MKDALRLAMKDLRMLSRYPPSLAMLAIALNAPSQIERGGYVVMISFAVTGLLIFSSSRGADKRTIGLYRSLPLGASAIVGSSYLLMPMLLLIALAASLILWLPVRAARAFPPINAGMVMLCASASLLSASLYYPFSFTGKGRWDLCWRMAFILVWGGEMLFVMTRSFFRIELPESLIDFLSGHAGLPVYLSLLSGASVFYALSFFLARGNYLRQGQRAD